MPAETGSNREPCLVYMVITTLFILLYVASWGPVGSLATNGTNTREIAQAVYAPVEWVYSNTALSTPLDWYWDLFGVLRPRELRNIPEIWEKAWINGLPDEEAPSRTHGGVI